MSEIDFDNTNQQTSQGGEGAEGITGFVMEKFGTSKTGARKVLLTVGILAFLVSLYFWFSLL